LLTIILIILAALLVTLCVAVFIIISAKKGWEDEKGFHKGTKEITRYKTKKKLKAFI
jgi:hypothetical protein